jgi:RNase P subunit RPR2
METQIRCPLCFNLAQRARIVKHVDTHCIVLTCTNCNNDLYFAVTLQHGVEQNTHAKPLVSAAKSTG